MNYKNISSVSTPKNTNKNFKMEDFNENATNRHNLAASSLKYIPNELPQAGNLFRSEMGSPAF